MSSKVYSVASVENRVFFLDTENEKACPRVEQAFKAGTAEECGSPLR